jgi:competence protein ComFB
VLNRIPPKYVVSGRGLNYNLSYSSPQIDVDIDALGVEGLRNISAIKRPYHGKNSLARSKIAAQTPVFNFPVFIGAAYDGRTFDPLADVTITLKTDNEPAEMCDLSWTNPCKTFNSTKGNFSFWVKYRYTEKLNEQKSFNFTIDVAANGYDPVSYSFDVNLMSEPTVRTELNLVYSHKVPDFFLFPHSYATESN